MDDKFIPTTKEVEIGGGIVYRPIRSWHSNTYAGEGLEKIPGTDDGSGCIKKTATPYPGEMCSKPLTVTHRLYWHKKRISESVSAFLSYPGAMGSCDEYFWEIYPAGKGHDIKRFFGENAEAEMEKYIKRKLKL